MVTEISRRIDSDVSSSAIWRIGEVCMNSYEENAGWIAEVILFLEWDILTVMMYVVKGIND